MRLAVMIVLVVLAAARFELSIRSGAATPRAPANGGFSLDIRLGGMIGPLLR